MTETPLPVVFDPETLEAAGVAYEPPGTLTTAHPHHDPERREMLNFATHLGPRSQYRFYGQRSRREQRVIAKAPVRHPGYVHSFGLSERYLILAVGPFTVDPVRLATSGRPYIENYRWAPEEGARFLVFDRESGELHRTYETDAFFVFHHINSFERDTRSGTGGELVVDLCAFEDASIIDALYLERLRSGGEIPLPQARRYVLGLDSGTVSMEPLSDVDLELPRINYRMHNTRPYRFAYGASAGSGDSFLGRIAKLDVESGQSWIWAQDGCFAGEPVFVPEPGAGAEDAGVLLSIVLDTHHQTSFLLVLDAATLDERARAEVPHQIPLAFHGQFFGA
jgi:carotenoid cleavage dioxygenase-like enzyme